MTTGKVNSGGIPLNKRSGPGTSYRVVGSIPDGTTVTILCQASGTNVTGQFGPTALWDRLGDGSYVSDAFVYTGTNSMVAPSCTDFTGVAGGATGGATGGGVTGGATGSATGGVTGGADQVTTWIDQALQVMNMPANSDTVGDLRIIIMHESSGNPNAENLTDINAQEGHPSKGLMQCIQPTFDRWHLEPYDNIFGPVDSIIAGTRYATNRYGSLDRVPGVVAVKAGQPYVGY